LPVKLPETDRVAFLPDGRRAFSVCQEKCTIWDVTSGKVIRTFRNPESDYQATALAVSPDGRQALSGTGSGYLHLWDLRRGKLIRRFLGTKPRDGGIGSVWFLPGGKRALATQQRSVKLWDVTAGKLLRTFRPKWWVGIRALSPDGKRAISDKGAGTVGVPISLIVWEVATGKRIFQLKDDQGFSGSPIFLAGGKRLLSATQFGSVTLWDLTTRKALRSWDRWPYFLQSRQWGRSFNFSPDRKLAVVSWGGTATIWDAVRGKFLRVLCSEGREGNGRDFAPLVVPLLQSNNARVRRTATEDLGKLGAAVLELVGSLKDIDGDVRQEAARSLGRIGIKARKAIGPLREALKDPVVRVRIAAALSLDQIKEGQAERALRVLEEALGHRDAQVRLSAVKALGKVSVGSAPVLCRALEDPSTVVRRQAARLLLNGGHERGVGPALTAALQDRDNQVRVFAAEALLRVGLRPEGIARALAGALQDPDPQVRRSAAQALRRTGGGAKTAVRELRQALRDKNNMVRVKAAEALLYLNGSDESVIPPLIEALEEDDDAVSKGAALCLGRFGPRAKAAIPALVKRLANPEVSRALVRIGPDSIPELIKALKDRTRRGPAIGALFELGKEKEAVRALIEDLEDKTYNVRRIAARALSRFGTNANGAIPALIAILNDRKQTPYLPVRCVNVLGGMGPKAKAAVPVLVDALNDPKVKYVVPWALKQIDPKAAAEAGLE
jgi:HEAT repeat protein